MTSYHKKKFEKKKRLKYAKELSDDKYRQRRVPLKKERKDDWKKEVYTDLEE